jgi:hypothetical protein
MLRVLRNLKLPKTKKVKKKLAMNLRRQEGDDKTEYSRVKGERKDIPPHKKCNARSHKSCINKNKKRIAQTAITKTKYSKV